MTTPTPLINSGSILFDPNPNTGGAVLPSNRPTWLNDKIIAMGNDIKDLQTHGAQPGKDGKQIELSVGFFPSDTDPNKKQAILWRYKPVESTDPQTWNLLMYEGDLIGPEGPRGPEGPQGQKGAPGKDGTSVRFHGQVEHTYDLVHFESQAGDGVIVKEFGDLWVLTRDPYTDPTAWFNAGHITGPQGPAGPQGPRGAIGPQGPAGSSGGIGQFVLQWIVDSATSAAISGVTAVVSSQVAAAEATLADQMATLAEDAAQTAAQEAVDKAIDELKGKKGDKGDKGDKGKDGASVRLVGKFKTKLEFQAKYPLFKDNVGVAGLIGKDGEQKELWAITEDSTGLPPYGPKYTNLGDIMGPKGNDANWSISMRDTSDTEKMRLNVDSSIKTSMYIRDSSSIYVDSSRGSVEDPNQVGLTFSMKYPIPQLAVKNDPSGHSSTIGKILSNDGQRLKWIDPPKSETTKDRILIKSPNGTVWSITIDDNGRMHQDVSTEQTNSEKYQLKSSGGVGFKLTVDDEGNLQVSNELIIRTIRKVYATGN